MSRIFISYRRKEGSKDAMALFERLARHFGADAVFMDVEGIAPGVDFQDVLDRTLDTCSVMLLLMGPDWAETKDDSGERRLDDPNDFVRVEVATALRRKIPLIPVTTTRARQRTAVRGSRATAASGWCAVAPGNSLPGNARVANRSRIEPTNRYIAQGFRLARTL